MCYDKNESIYFDVMENDQIFPSKFVMFIIITNSFLVEQ